MKKNRKFNLFKNINLFLCVAFLFAATTTLGSVNYITNTRYKSIAKAAETPTKEYPGNVDTPPLLSNSSSTTSSSSSTQNTDTFPETTPSKLNNISGGVVKASDGTPVTVPKVTSTTATASIPENTQLPTTTARTGGNAIVTTLISVGLLGGFVYYYRRHGNKKSNLKMTEKKISKSKRH